MKLRNKKTGGTMAFNYLHPTLPNGSVILGLIDDNEEFQTYVYSSLAEFNEEWEDAPSSVWYITHDGSIHSADIGNSWAREKNIGNYFETREEAEKALEKLKAWKRLRDKGLHVTTFYVEDGSLIIRARTHNSSGAENWEDLDLLFEGEEE